MRMQKLSKIGCECKNFQMGMRMQFISFDKKFKMWYANVNIFAIFMRM
jgi:hypothetical protein